MKLLTPISIGTLHVKNRVALPAMATNFGNPDGSVSQRLIDYYNARAKGGVGLIIIEFTAVAFGGRFTQNQLRIDHDRFVEGFARLVGTLHAGGARTLLQLHHSGRRSPVNLILTQPIAPSPIPVIPESPIPWEMTLDDIRFIREAFIRGALRAKQAGFDGVEIHATHGYLLAQFLSPLSNQRADAYGGNPENRARLTLEIIRGIKAAAGDDFPVIVKMTGDEYTPGGIEIEEALAHARLFAQNGADALCVSGSAGSLMSLSPKAPGRRSTSPPVYIEQACYAHLAAQVKKAVSTPVMAIGRINDPHVAEAILQKGQADLIAVGRGHIADPAFVNKCAGTSRGNLCYCIGCLQGCIEKSVQWSNTGITCAVNPRVGREAEATDRPAAPPKKIMVIGGGPAGMQAADILARRGHNVSLYDKKNRLGGTVLTASIPPGKAETLHLIDYLQTRLRDSGAEVHLQTAVDPELIRREKPDCVIIAAGGRPRKLKVPGVDGAQLFMADEILDKGIPASVKGRKAVVLGGGLVGCETALFLAKQGWQVKILELLEDIGIDVGPIIRFYLRQELEAAGVEICTKNCVSEFREGQVVCYADDDEALLHAADLAVLAVGYEADPAFFAAVREIVPEVYGVGDALRPRRILEAMRESFDIAQEI